MCSFMVRTSLMQALILILHDRKALLFVQKVMSRSACRQLEIASFEVHDAIVIPAIGKADCVNNGKNSL